MAVTTIDLYNWKDVILNNHYLHGFLQAYFTNEKRTFE